MKKFFALGVLVVALCGCKHSDYRGSEDGSTAMIFSPHFVAGKATVSSRATATSFDDGDRVGVYVVKQGQTLRSEFNAVDNHLFEYFATGDSLGSVPMAMYYPDKTTPVAIYAYYPYINGGERFSALAMPFNVANDQRVGDALTLSDLCLSRSGFAAPSASPRSLTFYHALSQVVVNVDYSAVADVDSLYSVRFLGVRSGVLVNLADGALTLQEAPSFVITGSIAILPPQTFEAGKLIEIQMRMNSGELAAYYFNPLAEITIAASRKNTFSLKLRNDSPEAELTGGAISITGWVSNNSGNGQLTERVSNDFALMYLNPKQGFTNIDRVVLTIASKEYEATNVTVKYMSDGTAKITFELNSDKGNAPKEYPYTITALKLFTNNELFFETNKDKDLVSSEVYKSGAKMLACGAFIPPIPPIVVIAGTKWCSTNLTGTPGQGATVSVCEKPEDYGMYFKWQDSYVFSSNSAWNGAANVVSGDPCKKLGSNYRTPTDAEQIRLNNSGANAACKLNNVTGAFFGPGAASLSGNRSSVPANMIFIPAAGYREASDGTFYGAGFNGYVWSSSPQSAPNGYYLYFGYNGNVYPSTAANRSSGFSVRCVQQ